MKQTKIIFLMGMVILFAKGIGYSQTVNWVSLQKEQRHVASANVGIDYGVTYGFGYGYQLKTKLPTLLALEHSQPTGGTIFDDFKTKLGGQIRLYQIKDFHFTAKVMGVFRRTENDYVRLLNFGSDMSAIFGYYKPKLFVAGEVGFDKAIITNFKHSDLYRENFPEVKDGWYKPATGGNFYYGLQAGWSFRQNDITLKVGKVIQQDFATDPLLPFYFQLGYNRRF